MYTFLVILFVLLSFLMVVVILMQAGKGQGLAGSIGGGGAVGGSVFGGRGAADFLSKSTSWIAAAYMIIAIIIGVIYKSEAEDAQRSLIEQRMEDAPAQPDFNIPTAPLPQQDQPTDSEDEQP